MCYKPIHVWSYAFEKAHVRILFDSFFVMRLLAKWYILQQVSEPTLPARNTLVQLSALYSNPESHNTQRHRQTDRRQDCANSQSYCVAVQSAKNHNCSIAAAAAGTDWHTPNIKHTGVIAANDGTIVCSPARLSSSDSFWSRSSTLSTFTLIISTTFTHTDRCITQLHQLPALCNFLKLITSQAFLTMHSTILQVTHYI